MMTVDLGDTPTIRATFNPVPSDCDMWLRLPDGTEVALAPVLLTGVWTAVCPVIDAPGLYTWRARGVAGGIAGEEGSFYVLHSQFDLGT